MGPPALTGRPSSAPDSVAGEVPTWTDGNGRIADSGIQCRAAQDVRVFTGRTGNDKLVGREPCPSGSVAARNVVLPMQPDDAPPKHRTRLFRNGNSQAVRIPKELAYPRLDMEMEIERRGDTLVIPPARQRLIGLARTFQAFGRDFMQEGRDQPDVPEREGAARER
jgi:antitoxin VapB